MEIGAGFARVANSVALQRPWSETRLVPRSRELGNLSGYTVHLLHRSDALRSNETLRPKTWKNGPTARRAGRISRKVRTRL